MSAIFPSCSGNPGMWGCGSAADKHCWASHSIRKPPSSPSHVRSSPPVPRCRPGSSPWETAFAALPRHRCINLCAHLPPPCRPAPCTCKCRSPPAPSTGLLGQNQGGWGFWRGRCNAEAAWRGRMGITLEGREREVHSLKKKIIKKSAFVSSAAGGTIFY